jgi:hypothetical protein
VCLGIPGGELGCPGGGAGGGSGKPLLRQRTPPSGPPKPTPGLPNTHFQDRNQETLIARRPRTLITGCGDLWIACTSTSTSTVLVLAPSWPLGGRSVHRDGAAIASFSFLFCSFSAWPEANSCTVMVPSWRKWGWG